MCAKIVDCHAHIFPPAAEAAGFPDVATHLLQQQRAMHMHGNQPYRHEGDDMIVTERMLWDPNDPSPAGAADVDFRVGGYGRYEWTKDNENYYVQFLPPWMDDMSMAIEQFVKMMDYAEIDVAILQNDHIYGNLGEMFSQAIQAHPERFIGTAQIDEGFAYTDGELAKLEDQINRLKMSGVYFTTTGMFTSGYQPMHSDMAYDPFWSAVEQSGLPVLWVQSTNSPVGNYEDEMSHLLSIMDRFPAINHTLVHGVPTSIYADENDILTLPDSVRTVLLDPRVRAEILYPISWGRTEEYPYSRAHLHIQQLVESFGAQKFMWGSDVPNVERYCTYAESLNYFVRHSAYLSDADRQAILHDNAVQFYAISEPRKGKVLT